MEHSENSFHTVGRNNQCDISAKSQSKMDPMLMCLNVIFLVIKTVLEFVFEYSFYIILAVIVSYSFYLAFRCYVCPETIVKELPDLGFTHIKSKRDRARHIARAQAARPVDNKIPPPYPNGWFAVAESRELKRGDVQAVDALGHNLCVYRGEDGTARCVDAYCPHLGANLAIGGSVCGNCIECPFHGWRFSEGVLVSVPGVETVPKGVSIKYWTTVEADGAVWIWHDAEGRPPLWEQKDAEELETFGYRGRNEFTVSCHIQEIPENGADVAHLNAVHGTSVLCDLGDKYPFLQKFLGTHYWTADWKKNEDHTTSIKLTHDYKLMKKDFFHVDVDVSQIGPGHVRLRMHTGFGPVLISHSVTPVAPLKQKSVFRVFTPSYNAVIGYIANKSEAYMFERDVAIWNNKRYVGAPAYVKSDKTIRSYRNWFNQFYSDNSVSFRDSMQNPLDW